MESRMESTPGFAGIYGEGLRGQGGKALPCRFKLSVFKKCVDVAFGDTGWCWPGGMVGLVGLRELFQP